MIQLKGCQARWFASSGSLGFDGLDGGHPPLIRGYKWLYRKLGWLDPSAFMVISKTITEGPRKGNLTPWSFWRAARLVNWRTRSMVNCVALTNPGFEEWRATYYPRATKARIKLILSVELDSPDQAARIGNSIQTYCKDLVGVQINSGCPNVYKDYTEEVEKADEQFVEIVKAFRTWCDLPLLVKYGAYQNWKYLTQRIESLGLGIAANDLINAVPWAYIGIPHNSPLAGYGYKGAVSGGAITYTSRLALTQYKALGLTTPLLSGGGLVAREGVSLEDEVRWRLEHGADGISFGTAFLWDPAGPNKVVRKLDKGQS